MAERDNIRVVLPVVPTLLGRDEAAFKQSLSGLLGDLKKVDVGFQKTSQTAVENIKNINKISKSAASFAKTLEKGSFAAVKQLNDLGRKLDQAHKEAEIQAEKVAKAAPEDREKALEDWSKACKAVADLNKQVEDSGAAHKKQIKAVESASQAYGEMVKKFSMSKVDFAKSVGMNAKTMFSGTTAGMKTGAVDLVGTVAKGMAAWRTKTLDQRREAAEKAGDFGGAANAAKGMETVQKGMMAFAGAAVAIGAIVELFKAASSHMTNLNKAMGAGEGFASELGNSQKTYVAAINDTRAAATASNDALQKYWLDSEKSLKIVGAFSKQATGSVIRTADTLKQLGRGDIQQGLFLMAKNAQLYGKALGMEATDIASMMGNFVSDIGMNYSQVNDIMGDVVKQAAQANMPLTKFVDIFKQAVPNLDLFTNRIQEVTGMIKLMSKTMDPRALKNFMNAFGKGFDQMDFRHRLKMALVVGPGEMAKIINKDIDRAKGQISKSLPESLKGAFDDAMKGKGSLTDLAAKATMMGVDGAVVGNIKRIERMQKLSKGGVLKQATAMRDMGMLARMDTLEKYAGRFTGGDITGIGEAVANTLGVSGQEYQAILDLKASMETHLTSAEKYGRTGSKSINDNLKKMFNLDRKNFSSTKEFEDAFENKMRDTFKSDPQGLKEMIKEAATMQMSVDAEAAKEDADKAATLEEIGVAQVKATRSLGEQVEGTLAVILEKVFTAIQGAIDVLNDIYAWLPNFMKFGGTDADRQKAKVLTDWSSKAASDSSLSAAGKEQYIKINNSIASLVEAGGNQTKLMNTFGSNLWSISRDKRAEALGSVGLSSEQVAKFESSNIADQMDLLRGMDVGDLAKVLSAGAYRKAQDVKDVDITERRVGSVSTDDLRVKSRSSNVLNSMGDKDVYGSQYVGGENEASKASVMASAGFSSATPASSATAATSKNEAAAAPVVESLTSVKEVATKQLVTSDEHAKTASDSLVLEKKMSKLDISWMNSKFEAASAKAVETGVRPPLREMTLLIARMWDEPEFRKGLVAAADESATTSAFDLAKIKYGQSSDVIQKMIKEGKIGPDGLPQAADGGYVERTGIAVIHKGEDIVPKGSGSMNVSVVINTRTDASAEEIGRVVRDKLYEIRTRQ